MFSQVTSASAHEEWLREPKTPKEKMKTFGNKGNRKCSTFCLCFAKVVPLIHKVVHLVDSDPKHPTLSPSLILYNHSRAKSILSRSQTPAAAAELAIALRLGCSSFFVSMYGSLSSLSLSLARSLALFALFALLFSLALAQFLSHVLFNSVRTRARANVLFSVRRCR